MEKLNQPGITSASIVRIKDLKDLERIFQSNISEYPNDSPYCLIVFFKTKKFVRITIYPIFKSRILKLSFKGNSHNVREIEVFSNDIQKFEIIHSTGLIIIRQELTAEFYLNLNFADEKFKNLNILLDKHKNKFKDIKLEEIVLK
ncbi:MAG: hypothetical protein ACFE9R_11375 [Candidatus Hermodarchaeota archaeon]